MIGNLFAFLAMLPELFKEIRKAIRLYRRAVAEGWVNEHRQIGDAVENAQTDEDRRKLARAATDLMRKPD